MNHPLNQNKSVSARYAAAHAKFHANQTTFEIIDAFTNAAHEAGLEIDDLTADGQLHRCKTVDDKAGKKSGAYVLHLDGVPAGRIWNWRTGEQQTWCAKRRDELTVREHADMRRMVEAAKRQRQAEQAETHREAAIKAAQIWSRCKQVIFHDYLRRKGILPFGARIDRYDNLVVPATDGEKITTLQFIKPSGQKIFLSGGKKRGCYFVIGDDPSADKILICEGFATGATLHMQTRWPVVVAFDAGNLLPVARRIRRTFPAAEIIIAADNDQWTLGNPGLTKARAAALAIGGKLLVPDFTGLDTSGKPTDWNDWRNLRRHNAGSSSA